MRLWRAVSIAKLTPIAALLAGCAGPHLPPAKSLPPSAQPPANVPAGSAPTTRPAQSLPALPAAGSGRGGYYQDDGPGDNPPEGLNDTPDAEPKIEPYSKTKNKPYAVFGKTYTPILDERPFKQRGIGSWYGKKFHGQRTSSGELYDMYKMTAAHPTLPIPSYARITSLSNGRQVIVRINDRGPFHSNRIADLSYTAALKLGFLGKGSHEIEIERLLPNDIARLEQQRNNGLYPTNGASPTPLKTDVAQAARVIPEKSIVSAAPPQAAVPESVSAPLAIETMLQTDRVDLTIPAAVANALIEAAPAVVPTIAPAAPIAAQSGGYYLQLGAYSQADNAESMRAKLAQTWPASNLPSLEIVQSGNIYRLYSGPFETRAAAAGAAQQVQNEASVKALVVQRAVH